MNTTNFKVTVFNNVEEGIKIGNYFNRFRYRCLMFTHVELVAPYPNLINITFQAGKYGLAPSGADAGPVLWDSNGNELTIDGAIVSYSLIEGGYNGTGN